jgi:hypothetical protein
LDLCLHVVNCVGAIHLEGNCLSSGSSQKYAYHLQPQDKVERQLLLNIIVGHNETVFQAECQHASSLHIGNL